MIGPGSVSGQNAIMQPADCWPRQVYFWDGSVFRYLSVTRH